jgi:uncharacterized protein with PQ loop repeat
MTLPANVIGSIAAFSTTMAFVPQLVRVEAKERARYLPVYVSPFALAC